MSRKEFKGHLGQRSLRSTIKARSGSAADHRKTPVDPEGDFGRRGQEEYRAVGRTVMPTVTLQQTGRPVLPLGEAG